MEIVLRTERAEEVKSLIEGMQRRGHKAEPVLRQYGGYMREMVLEHFAKGMGPTGPWKEGRRAGDQGGKTLYDTGRLAGSISGQGSLISSDVEVRLGTRVKYARIHQEGGVIKPVNAKWLTVPVEASRRKKARDYEDAFVIMGSHGPLLVRKKGKGKNEKLVILYALKKSVTMPARPYMWFDAGADDRLVAMLAEWVEEGK